ncbi:Asparaginase [Fusarium sp. LHS14.1]|nr:Asparaginase [Fusarium sp. LHS14.1]
MPEIAAFLALTVTSDKPIVMTGAIKPHTAIGADGPGNIVAAVNTATTTGWSSMGHEVVIVIQDKVMAPWGTKKENSLFLPGPRSLLGGIVDLKPFFRWLPGPCAPMKFDISQLVPETSLPEVAILPAHQDFRSGLVAAAIDMGAKGIVLVGYGDGYWLLASGIGRGDQEDRRENQSCDSLCRRGPVRIRGKRTDWDRDSGRSLESTPTTDLLTVSALGWS